VVAAEVLGTRLEIILEVMAVLVAAAKVGVIKHLDIQHQHKVMV
jgi:hypothetical protein